MRIVSGCGIVKNVNTAITPRRKDPAAVGVVGTPAGSTEGRPVEVAVRSEGLTKHFGTTIAVDRLDLAIPRGVVAGFIGPNGAGKTTTMAMLLGLVRPTAGSATVLGHDIGNPGRYMGRVGALVEGPALWPSLTGRENLRNLALLGGHDPDRAGELLGAVGLEGRGEDRFGGYSLGMRQRLGIAAALVGDPDLLLLDEPTNGLDPRGIHEMRALIGRLGADGRTVMVSSHLLGELEQISDWLTIIDHGRVRYNGAADVFLAGAEPHLVAVPERSADVERAARIARAEGLDVDLDAGRILIALDRDRYPEVAGALNRTLLDNGIVLTELYRHHPNLEEHYLSQMQGAAS